MKTDPGSHCCRILVVDDDEGLATTLARGSPDYDRYSNFFAVLQQDPVHIRVGIQPVDLGQQLFGGRGLGQLDLEGVHADTTAGIALHLDVGGGGRVGPDQQGGQNGGAAAAGLEGCNTGGQFGFDAGGELLAIEHEGGHGGLRRICEGADCRTRARGGQFLCKRARPSNKSWKNREKSRSSALTHLGGISIMRPRIEASLNRHR